MLAFKLFIYLPISVILPLQTVLTQIRPEIMSGLIRIKLFDTNIVFLKESFGKIDVEKKSAEGEKSCKITH